MRHQEERVSLWDRYDGERYFFHDLVWGTDITIDRSTCNAYLYGTCNCLWCSQRMCTRMVDSLLMRFTEIFLSIPNLLLVILLQAVLGKASIFSISFIIGITSWPSIAKVVRTEVKQIRNSGYVIAARCMGGSFRHVLWKHLTPNFASSIMFMVVMNIRSAIIAESTLSFMGIGLPLEQISWEACFQMQTKH